MNDHFPKTRTVDEIRNGDRILYRKPPMTENEISSDARLRIGSAGWSIPSAVAPNFDTSGSHLQRYSEKFNCCEINSSFYRPHRTETWTRWATSVPEEFRFSVKVPKSITHEAKLNCTSEALSQFLNQISFLGEKLGPILVQLPPTLEFDNAIAAKFLSTLRRTYQGEIAWEPRHRSWFERRANDLLKEYKIARAAADPACVPEAGDPGGISHFAYFRLHGSPRLYYSCYSSEFLNRLSSKLLNLAHMGTVWCIFDNTASGSAIQNALDLYASLDSAAPRLFQHDSPASDFSSPGTLSGRENI